MGAEVCGGRAVPHEEFQVALSQLGELGARRLVGAGRAEGQLGWQAGDLTGWFHRAQDPNAGSTCGSGLVRVVGECEQTFPCRRCTSLCASARCAVSLETKHCFVRPAPSTLAAPRPQVTTLLRGFTSSSVAQPRTAPASGPSGAHKKRAYSLVWRCLCPVTTPARLEVSSRCPQENARRHAGDRQSTRPQPCASCLPEAWELGGLSGPGWGSCGEASAADTSHTCRDGAALASRTRVGGSSFRGYLRTCMCCPRRWERLLPEARSVGAGEAALRLWQGAEPYGADSCSDSTPSARVASEAPAAIPRGHSCPGGRELWFWPQPLAAAGHRAGGGCQSPRAFPGPSSRERGGPLHGGGTRLCTEAQSWVADVRCRHSDTEQSR